MVEYTKVNIRLSGSQLKKLKDAVSNNTGTTLRISLKMFNGKNLPHELLLTTRQKTKIRNAFNNNTFTDIKFSKAQINEITQSGGFLGRLLGPLLKTGLPLIKNVIKPLAKSVLIPLNDIIKIVQALKDSNILLKGVTETVKNETKKQEGGFLSMLLGFLGASLLEHLLTGKGVVRAGYGNNEGKGVVKTCYGNHSQNKMDF